MMTPVILNQLPAGGQLSSCQRIMAVLLLILLHLPACFLEFHIGRLREGQFEYPRLNGWMTPYRAKRRCDRDQQCGGFTYKGFITLDSSQEFNIFFFHLLLNFEDGAESWHWVTYKAEKEFIEFENLADPESSFLIQSKPLVSTTARIKCLQLRTKCAGIVEKTDEVLILSSLALDRLQPSLSQKTLVKLELPYTGAGEGVSGQDSYQSLNRCCPATNLTEAEWHRVIREAKRSQVPDPVPCNMDPEDFKKQYVLRTTVGKLTGCQKKWGATRWTLEGMLSRGNGKWLWNTNFVDSSGLVKDTSEQGKLRRGTEVMDMMRNNLTVRLFDPIAVHETFMHKRKNEIMKGTNKLELRQDYSRPTFLKTDMFEACQVLTDYQWSLIAGPNTGTSIHLDPPFANSWNTVLQGHKLWAILPPDTEPKVLMCDPGCSENGAELSPLSWFLHVLPQLRGRRFYGQEIQEVLQGPGDTLYIPSRSPHAVLNLDWSLGITENVMTEEMLLELPHKLLMGEGLLPDTEAWPGERREERIWKCLTRGKLLTRWARARLRGVVQQVESRLTGRSGVCRQQQYGRTWLRELEYGLAGEV